MKNLFVLALVAGMFVVASCGGKKDAKEQARLDSLKKDSIAKVEKQKAAEDSIKEAEALEQARLDSIAKAKEDSIAKLKGGNYTYNNTRPNNNTTTTTTTTTTGTKTRPGATKVN